MPWFGSLLLAGACLYAADRLLLWAESRGWIFYRKRTPQGGGGALLGVATELFQPSQHSAIQEIEQDSRLPDAGSDADPLDPTATALHIQAWQPIAGPHVELTTPGTPSRPAS